jgi:hypothetical protein
MHGFASLCKSAPLAAILPASHLETTAHEHRQKGPDRSALRRHFAPCLERAALLSSAPWLAREHAAQEFKRLLDALHALTQFAPQQRNRLQARLDERLDQQLQQLGSESARPC